MEILKVSSKSNPNSVAGALANIFKNNSKIEMQAIGAGALNQAVKSVIICKGFLAPSGKTITINPSFSDIQIEDETRTAIRLLLEIKN